MEYSRVLYGPVYQILSAPATLTLRTGASFPLRVIDQTAGLSLEQGAVLQIETTRPVALARVLDLTAIDVALDDLDDATLLLNEVNWRVTAYKPNPSPQGRGDGEVYLFLEGDAG